MRSVCKDGWGWVDLGGNRFGTNLSSCAAVCWKDPLHVKWDNRTNQTTVHLNCLEQCFVGILKFSLNIHINVSVYQIFCDNVHDVLLC